MNGRKVWAIKWKLSDGAWVKYYGLTFMGAMGFYVPLFNSGVRSMVLYRSGVNAVRNY